MRRPLPALLACTGLLLCGCATMDGGDHQLVNVVTDPPGAACVVDKLGAPPGDHMAEIPSTPETVLVHKSDARLKITCAKQGSPTIQALQPPGLNYFVIGNVLNGVIVGTAIDAASGGLYRYPQEVRIVLADTPPPAPAPRAMPATARAPAPPPALLPPPVAAPRVPVTPTPLEPPARPR